MSAVSFIPSEIGIGLGIVLLTGTSFFIVESIFNMLNTINNRYLQLLPYTASSEDKEIVLQQDVAKFPKALPILPSDNETTGIEFAYSFYLSVNENTFDGEEKLHNVFYRGYPKNPWPLQSPGVYILGNVNTMRIIFNSYNMVYNYVDIENIPIDKWFHVVLNFQNLILEVHVNGKLAKTLVFNNTLPYINSENITIFSNIIKTVNTQPNQGTNIIQFSTSVYGKLSNLIYTRYGLSYNEIQSLYKAGPSSKTAAAAVMEAPPYFADSWWANQ